MKRSTVFLSALGVGVVLGLTLGAASAAPLPADKLPEQPLALPPAGPEATYLDALHTHIHHRWSDNFLRLIGEKLEPTIRSTFQTARLRSTS